MSAATSCGRGPGDVRAEGRIVAPSWRSAAARGGPAQRRRDRGLQAAFPAGPAGPRVVGLGSRGSRQEGGPSDGDLVVRVAAFVDRIELAYSCADLMVTRAEPPSRRSRHAASRRSSFPTCTPPGATKANARALERAGGATLIADRDLSPTLVAERIEAVIDYQARLDAMRRGSASFGRPDAAAALGHLTAQIAARAPDDLGVPATRGASHASRPRPRGHLVGASRRDRRSGMMSIARLLLARGVGSRDRTSRTPPAAPTASGGRRAWSVTTRADGAGGRVRRFLGDPPDNLEVVEARRRRIPVYARAQVLAALMAERRGSPWRGPTARRRRRRCWPCSSNGRVRTRRTWWGDLNESGSNARSGGGDLFVAEADESDGSFLLLHPQVGIVTNVEEDHMDFYEDREELEAAFAAFGRQAGLLVACGDDPGARRAVSGPSLAS